MVGYSDLSFCLGARACHTANMLDHGLLPIKNTSCCSGAKAASSGAEAAEQRQRSQIVALFSQGVVRRGNQLLQRQLSTGIVFSGEAMVFKTIVHVTMVFVIVCNTC